MNLFWIRHFPVAAKGCYIGHTDVDALLPAEPLAEPLGKAGALWFASPLSRAVQTAEFLGAPGLQTAPELMEQHFGVWEGKPYDCVQCDWANPAGMKPEGGESFEELCIRVHGWLDKLLARHKGRDAVIVAHAGTVRAGLAHALNISAAQALAFKIDYGSVTSVSYFSSDETAACINYINRMIKHSDTLASQRLTGIHEAC